MYIYIYIYMYVYMYMCVYRQPSPSRRAKIRRSSTPIASAPSAWSGTRGVLSTLQSQILFCTRRTLYDV